MDQGNRAGEVQQPEHMALKPERTDRGSARDLCLQSLRHDPHLIVWPYLYITCAIHSMFSYQHFIALH